MNNKIIYISTLLVAFLIGCLITYIAMTKQQMDAVMANSTHVSQVPINQTESSQDISATNGLDSLAQHESRQKLPTQRISNNIKDGNQTISVNDYSQIQAKAIVDDMPDYVLGQYVDKFMAKDASNMIDDKRHFAERAVEELYTPNDNQPLHGDVKLSLHPAMPLTSLDTTTINKDAKLYAHLDLSSSRNSNTVQVPASPYVFIKWVNNQTGQVLLFEQKSIKADSDQNWVSFKPYDGWQVGSYDIRFYQFTAELQPIAQLTYNIYEVVE